MRVPRLFSILLQIFLAGFDKNSQSDGVKTFIVQSYGYTHCPQFPTLREAQSYLRELVTEELQKARSRGHKQARKHKIGADCYRITLGSDPQSTLYSHHCILTA